MIRFFITAMLGALLFFIWNAISWMGLPFHGNSLQTLPESFITSATSNMPSGIYHYPGFDTPNMAEKVAQGPRVPFMVYISGSTSLFDPMSFLTNFLYNLITAVFLLIILMKQQVKSTGAMFSTAILIGLIISFASDFPQMNWYMFPFDYTLINVFDHLIGFGLVGLLFSWRIQRQTIKE